MAAVDIEIGGSTVGRVIAVPRREINSEFETAASGGFGEFANDVAFAVFVRAELDRVVGGFGGPEAEAVVMFASEDDALAAGVFKDCANGIGIEGGGVEDGGIFVAFSPFFVGKSVYCEVQEVVEAEFAPA